MKCGLDFRKLIEYYCYFVQKLFNKPVCLSNLRLQKEFVSEMIFTFSCSLLSNMTKHFTAIFRCCLFIMILSCGFTINAQIVLTPNGTANVLIDRLVGSGIIYTNPTLTCPVNASGKFDNGMASSVLIDSGVILTTGRLVTNAGSIGVNGIGSDFASVNNITNGGDANLSTAAGTSANNIHDLCKLEFDFIPTGDTIQFNYRFGSEEYPQYNCSDYNDIFAFFITGPGYATPTNLALIPGTTIPVTINSINNGTISAAGGGVLTNCTSLGPGSPFTSLYVNNTSSTTITYNGLTAKLTAKAAVTPCSTYHMKFAIADVSDHIYDSGVFLEAGSFTSDIASVIQVTSSNTLASVNAFAIEGCSPGLITISRHVIKPYPQIVTYTLTGTATNGVDVSTLSGSATIPANDSITTITINALQDGITEGTETLVFHINGSLCGSGETETLTLDILEYPQYTKPLNDTICNGQSVNLQVVPTPANPNIGISWSPAGSLNTSTGTAVTASPASTTTYTITSTYPGCPTVDSMVTISVDPMPTLALTPANVSCNGLVNGSITATGNATAPFTIILNPSGAIGTTSPFVFSNLGAGTYTVVISSVAGCTTSAVVSITQPNSMVWTNTQSTNPLCAGVPNGSIQVNASGGTGTINYTLLPGSSTNTSGNFPGLLNGTYTVNAVDASGCSVSTQLTLNIPNAIVWTSVNSTNITPCNGASNGTITVSANGGIGTLTYTLNPLSIMNTSGVYTGLGASVYTVVVSDINGCTNATNLTVTQPSQVFFNAGSSLPVTCYGGSNGSLTSHAVGGTGAIQYTLMPGSVASSTGTYTNLSSANYTITASDANGCTATTFINVAQPTAMQFTTFNTSNVACNGGNNGAIHSVITGGTGIVQYTLAPPATTNTSGTFTSLPAGSYTVTATDANGCTKSSVAIITQQSSIVFNSLLVINVDCNGNSNGSIQVTASGGSGTLQYQLTPGAVLNTTGIFNALLAGNYSITVSDVMGCTNSIIAIITQPGTLQIASFNVVHPSCLTSNNGSISLSAIGGTSAYTYAINTGVFTSTNAFNNLIGGSYTLHIKDAHGCLKDTIVTLTPLSNLQLTNIVTQQIACKFDSTGSISLNAGGGVMPYTYQLNGLTTGSTSSYSNLPAGTYSIHVSDNVGCVDDTVLTLMEPLLALAFNTINLEPVLCYGDFTGSINLSAIGGTPPYSYSFNSGAYQASGYFSGLGASYYLCTVKDLNGCTKDTVLQIKQPASPVSIHLNKLQEITCVGLHDGILYTGATGGIKPYVFTINGISNGNDSVFTNLNFGSYTIQVTDSNGCKTSAIYTIAEPTNHPGIVIENMIGNVCKGDQQGMIDWTSINGFMPYQYTFNGNFIDTLSEQHNLTSGTYLIQMTDIKGCKADTSITITNSTTLDVSVQTEAATCTGDGNDGKAIAYPQGGEAPYTYEWVGYFSSNQSLENISYGDHIVIIKDHQLCSDTASYTIEFVPCCELYMPNAFSPNNDGHNDTYRMIPYGTLKIKSFELFNRWGEKIYFSNSIDGEWDGKFKGVDSELGTYYYLIQYYCQLSTKLMMKKGDFTLLR